MAEAVFKKLAGYKGARGWFAELTPEQQAATMELVKDATGSGRANLRELLGTALRYVVEGKRIPNPNGTHTWECPDGTMVIVRGASCTCPRSRGRTGVPGQRCEHVIAEWILRRAAEMAAATAAEHYRPPLADVLRQACGGDVIFLTGYPLAAQQFDALPPRLQELFCEKIARLMSKDLDISREERFNALRRLVGFTLDYIATGRYTKKKHLVKLVGHDGKPGSDGKLQPCPQHGPTGCSHEIAWEIFQRAG